MMIKVNKSKLRKSARLFALTLACFSFVQVGVLAKGISGVESSSTTVIAQNEKVTIQGVIMDGSLGAPMIGVSILEKGTTNGTISDLDGKFSLSVKTNSTIVISMIGYKMQEIKVEGEQSLDIVLEEDVQGLDEVIVVGYTTQKK